MPRVQVGDISLNVLIAPASGASNVPAAEGAGASTENSRSMPVSGMEHGRLAGEPLLLLHGFTGCAANWLPFFPEFSRYGPVVAVDLPGHGASDAPLDPSRYRIGRILEDLAQLVDHLGANRCHLLGYSMGARLAMHLALHIPGRFSSLILESGTPGIEDPEARRRRAAADRRLANEIENRGMAKFVDEWEQLPLWDSQKLLPEETRLTLRRQRMSNRPHGLANCLRALSPGVLPSLWSRLEELSLPTLILAGSLDRRYCETAGRMAGELAAGRQVIVPGAGHNVHLEKPRLFAREVCRFIAGITGRKQPDKPAGCTAHHDYEEGDDLAF